MRAKVTHHLSYQYNEYAALSIYTPIYSMNRLSALGHTNSEKFLSDQEIYPLHYEYFIHP